MFDHGITMEKRAEGAPVELEQIDFMVGQWDVAVTQYDNEGKPTESKGLARLDRMNRGHGVMKRFVALGGEGNPWNTHSFIVYQKAASTWGEGVADSKRLDIRIYSGGFRGDRLVLENVERRLGGMTMTVVRIQYVKNQAGEVVDVQEAFQFIAFEPTPVAAANRFVWSAYDEKLKGETIVIHDMESDLDLRIRAGMLGDSKQFKLFRIVCNRLRGGEPAVHIVSRKVQVR